MLSEGMRFATKMYMTARNMQQLVMDFKKNMQSMDLRLIKNNLWNWSSSSVVQLMFLNGLFNLITKVIFLYFDRMYLQNFCKPQYKWLLFEFCEIKISVITIRVRYLILVLMECIFEISVSLNVSDCCWIPWNQNFCDYNTGQVYQIKQFNFK